jgi:hypothetical protein
VVLGALLLVAALAAALVLWPEGGEPPATDEDAASPGTTTGPTWAPLPPPPGPVPDAPGVTEHRGELWVVGGDGSTESFAYDPDTEEWRTAPPLPRDVHHGSLVSDGTSLWLVGGLHGADEALKSVYRLTDEPAGWQEGPALPEPRFSGAAVWDGDRVVFAGGTPSIARRNRLGAADVWALPEDGDRWVEVGQLSQGREHLAAATDAVGTAWFLGGVEVVSGEFFADVDLVIGSSVTAGPPLDAPRHGVAAVWTAETGPCAMGGSTTLPNEADKIRLTTVECPGGGDRYPWPALPEATYNAGGAVLGRTVYVVGGTTDSESQAWLRLSLP